MINFSVNVKSEKVRGDLVKFNEYLGKLTGVLLKQEACLTARAALKYAPPVVGSEAGQVGGGKGDKAIAGVWGARAVDKDIRSIFAPKWATLSGVFSSGDVGSEALFKLWKAKPLKNAPSTMTKIHADSDLDRSYKKAKAIYGGGKSTARYINNAGQMRLIHEGQRRNGRIVREGGPAKDLRRYPYIAKEAMIRAYVKKRQLEVGKLKSGWWQIISTHGRGLNIFGRIVDAGAKGLPKYITRHRGPGTLAAQLTGATKKVTITNTIGDNDNAGLKVKTFALTINHRRQAILKRPYQVYADRLVRNWNKSQPPSA